MMTSRRFFSDSLSGRQWGAVDESFAARRLRRWIKGMFGGQPAPPDEPQERDRGEND